MRRGHFSKDKVNKGIFWVGMSRGSESHHQEKKKGVMDVQGDGGWATKKKEEMDLTAHRSHEGDADEMKGSCAGMKSAESQFC